MGDVIYTFYLQMTCIRLFVYKLALKSAITG
jgi:hypothetical protein